MDNLLLWIGRLAGFAGFLICAAAFGARLAGTWYLAGVPAATLLQVGMAAMILGCLAYCAHVAEQAQK